MMGWRIKLKNGYEYDVTSRKWRHWLCYMGRAGVSSAIKRQMRKRLRRLNKRICKKEV
jgi:hypothetical protein